MVRLSLSCCCWIACLNHLVLAMRSRSRRRTVDAPRVLMYKGLVCRSVEVVVPSSQDDVVLRISTMYETCLSQKSRGFFAQRQSSDRSHVAFPTPLPAHVPLV